MILKFLGQPNTGGFLSQRSVALIYVSAWDREKSCKKRWLGSQDSGSQRERGFKSRKGKIEFRFLKWGDQTELRRTRSKSKGGVQDSMRGKKRWNVSRRITISHSTKRLTDDSKCFVEKNSQTFVDFTEWLANSWTL